MTYLKDHSGLTWSETHGASITAADETVWADIIKKHPAASPFRNQGWALYDLVSALKPAKPKGSHVYRASSGIHGQTETSAPPPPSKTAPPQSSTSDDVPLPSQNTQAPSTSTTPPPQSPIPIDDESDSQVSLRPQSKCFCSPSESPQKPTSSKRV